MSSLTTPRGGEASFQTLRAVVKTAFHKRRKTLRNSFKHVTGAVDAMENAGVSPKLRPEQVEVDAFVGLARAFDALDIDVLMPGEKRKRVRHMETVKAAQAVAAGDQSAESEDGDGDA